MEVTATVRYLGIAPRKVRLAAAVVKGMDVARAEYQLMHRTRRAAPVLLKLLRSATANARHNFHAKDQDLEIKDIRINAGPTTSRYRARAFGRAASITRRTSHISLVLETTKSAAVIPARTRQAAPVAREVTAEDLRGPAGSPRNTPDAGEKTRIPRRHHLGFVRRIFQRKAI